jgi:hypothetical protein
VTRSDYQVEVSARNGRPQRLVSIRRHDGVELRDTLDTDSSFSRCRLVGKAVKKFGADADHFDWLEDDLVLLADAADMQADEAYDGEAGQKSTADLLVELALSRYRIGRTEVDEAFAVEIDGPNVALMFRGSRDALRSSLSRAFRQTHERTPNSSALSDTLTSLQGEAYEAEPEAVHLRVAEKDDAIVVDLGDSQGRAVVVRPDGWQVVDRSPILFRRTAATGRLPIPEKGGSLTELGELVNISPNTWPLVVGWLVSALVPNMPHPILLLGGQQGTGKSSAARQLGGIIDPSPAPLRSQPRDEETWAVSAAASWLVAVDNISTISQWWSDSLCKAVTGDGWIRRKLFSDGDLAVLSFRRVIVLTSIDAGALKGDLGDRVVLVDLEPIAGTERRTEREIDAQYQKARPRIFGALLDLLAKTLSELRTTSLSTKPRMADFGLLLAAVDRAAGHTDIRALDIYLGQRQRIAETVIESDPFALAIRQLVEDQGKWSGTSSGLLELLSPERPPRDWPRTPQGVGGRLTRLIPALEQAGVAVVQRRVGHDRRRQYWIGRVSDMAPRLMSASSASSAPAKNPPNSGDGVRTIGGPCRQPVETSCPQQSAEKTAEWPPADNADDHLHRLSDAPLNHEAIPFRAMCTGRLTSDQIQRLHSAERMEASEATTTGAET